MPSRGREGDGGREPWKRRPALQQHIQRAGEQGRCGSVQPAGKRSREAPAREGRDAEGREAQMPSGKLVLHVKAFDLRLQNS